MPSSLVNIDSAENRTVSAKYTFDTQPVLGKIEPLMLEFVSVVVDDSDDTVE